MTNEEMKDVKMAWARGEVVQYRVLGGHWTDWGYDNELYVGPHEWRTKPKTIRIGNYDVPEPLRSFDGVKEYYKSCIDTVGYLYAIQCENDHLDTLWLERGLCHATREAAELHSKALLSFTETK